MTDLISIHAPREGSDQSAARQVRPMDISIHAPREGSDSCTYSWVSPFSIFLSTLPARGATPFGAILPGLAHQISIHAPREGSDGASSKVGGRSTNFYPRSPRGERRYRPGRQLRGCAISIHAPREGSDDEQVNDARDGCEISIHAPREGSDC